MPHIAPDEPRVLDLQEAVRTLRAQRDALARVLRTIAYEPIGPAEASAVHVLAEVTRIARKALATLDAPTGQEPTP